MERTDRKKIIYLVTKSNWGGAQKYVYDLIFSLDKNKYEPILITGGKGPLSEKVSSLKLKVIYINELERDVKIFKEIIIFFKLISILMREKPNIIHVNSSKIGGLGTIAGRLVNVKKIIFTVHGWPFKEERNFLSLVIIKFFSWLTVVFSTKTIVLSDSEMILGRKMPFIKNKLIKIYNGVDTNINILERDEARNFISKKIGLHLEKKIVIGTIAELTPNKGLKYAIKAISKINLDTDIVFVIMGDGEDRVKLEKLIKERKVQNKIFLLGKTLEASSYLKGLDIFILPSIKEGFPYAILEAGLARLPVIATNVGGVREIIKNNQTGILIEPKNEKLITKSIEQIFRDKEFNKKIRENLYQSVKTHFRLEKQISETTKLYS